MMIAGFSLGAKYKNKGSQALPNLLLNRAGVIDAFHKGRN